MFGRAQRSVVARDSIEAARRADRRSRARHRRRQYMLDTRDKVGASSRPVALVRSLLERAIAAWPGEACATCSCLAGWGRRFGRDVAPCRVQELHQDPLSDRLSPGSQQALRVAARLATETNRSVDLVVIGSHGRTGIKRVLLGRLPRRSCGTRIVPCSSRGNGVECARAQSEVQ